MSRSHKLDFVEAKYLLDRLIEESYTTSPLTPNAIEALQMGIEALSVWENLENLIDTLDRNRKG